MDKPIIGTYEVIKATNSDMKRIVESLVFNYTTMTGKRVVGLTVTNNAWYTVIVETIDG